ncbi:hypothetical protein Tco_0352140 [Tanacetum coccineum]
MTLGKPQWAAAIVAVVARCWVVTDSKGPEKSMLVCSYQDLKYLDTGLHHETHHNAREQAIKAGKETTTVATNSTVRLTAIEQGRGKGKGHMLDEGTAEPKDGTSDESTAPTTVFRDDETIAEFLVSMSQTKAKQKGVEIKDAEDSDRPRATSTRSVLTLKPLPKIDPKDKGKKVLEEEAESEGVDEAERKFDQLAKDEEIARKEVPCSTKSCCNQKQTTNKNSAKKPNDDLYEAYERQIKEMIRIKDLIEEIKEEGFLMKLQGRRHNQRPRPQPDDDSDDEHRKCLRIVTFDSTLDSEIIEIKYFVSKLHKVLSPDGDYLNNQKEWEIFRWGLYEACGDCILELKDRTIIYMLVDKKVPSLQGIVAKIMLDFGNFFKEKGLKRYSMMHYICITDHKELASQEANRLLLRVGKSWLVQDQTVPVQKQTAFGKDKSNPLIVDSLLKTIRLSIHLVVYNEELAIPEQTATEGKLKENQGCRVDTDQVHQNGDLKNRSVWIHPPGLQDVYTKET